MDPGPPQPIPPATDPSAPPTRPARRWLTYLVSIVVIGAIWTGISYFGGGSKDATSELKADVIRAIREHDGTEVKTLSLKLDDKVGDRPGQGYSGTATLANGEVDSIEVWLEHYFNSKGGGDLMHWTLKKPSAPATNPSP